MKPIRHGEPENNISSETVTFSDTGETYDLSTKTNSTCHFFNRFTVGNDDIQLRLDWSDLDHKGHPTLDADFINKKNGKHRSVKGKRKSAHHTASLPGEDRCYEWTFDEFSYQFSVKIVWLASMLEKIHVSNFCSAEIVSKEGRKNEDG